MRAIRTYSMELKTLELLSIKKNKSLIINLAVQRYCQQEDAFDWKDIATDRILRELAMFRDLSPSLKALIELELTSS